MYSCARHEDIRDTKATAPGISNLETRWRRVISLTIWLLYLRANIPSYPVRVPGPVWTVWRQGKSLSAFKRSCYYMKFVNLTSMTMLARVTKRGT